MSNLTSWVLSANMPLVRKHSSTPRTYTAADSSMGSLRMREAMPLVTPSPLSAVMIPPTAVPPTVRISGARTRKSDKIEFKNRVGGSYFWLLKSFAPKIAFDILSAAKVQNLLCV